jgi:biopolymer transport protein ExbD
MVSAKQDDDVMAEINITPFTDVLLVTPPGFQKELPNNNNAPPTNQNDNKKNIDVEVNDKGVIFVDNQKTDEKSIYYVMSQTAQKRGHIHVSITADTKAPYGIIIRILDAAKEANLDDVGFVTS